MKPPDVARRYMDMVFRGGDVGELSQMLGRKFHFRRPFHEFDSAAFSRMMAATASRAIRTVP